MSNKHFVDWFKSTQSFIESDDVFNCKSIFVFAFEPKFDCIVSFTCRLKSNDLYSLKGRNV